MAVSMTAPALLRVDDERGALQRAVLLTALTALGLAFGIAGQVGLGPAWLAGTAFLVAYLAGGVPPSIGALKSLREGRLDIDLLMVVAALAAAVVGEARDGAILLFLFSLAGTLEDYAMGRTKRAVEALMELRPEQAHRVVAGAPSNGGMPATETVPAVDLVVGDRVVVRPGERLPVDGRIVEGASSIDQAAVTGESMPVDRGPGEEVFAATVNGQGVLVIEMTRSADESTVARMVRLVTQARAERAPAERFSAWFGQRYTVFVLAGSALALAAFLGFGDRFEDALYRAATLLVAASPCAIVISVPAAILSALAAAARGGMLFKSGLAIEALSNVDIVAFDKTGTLTQGRPQVAAIHAFAGDEATVLALAAGLEAHSEHPLAASVRAAAKARGLEAAAVADVQAVPGHGVVGTHDGREVWIGSRRMAMREGAETAAAADEALSSSEAQGLTLLLVGEGDRLLGAIAVADPLRPSAVAALAGLRDAGVRRLVMLTGDHPAAAARIARALDLAELDVEADLLPEDKLRRVRELRREGRVAYVGDGVNDAAALAAADVGIAMGAGGSDVALEAADVALISDDLAHLVRGRRLATRANRIIKQNFGFAIGAMVVLVLLTLFAELSLPLAVIGHEGGTLLVVFNGLRLLLTRGG